MQKQLSLKQSSTPFSCISGPVTLESSVPNRCRSICGNFFSSPFRFAKRLHLSWRLRLQSLCRSCAPIQNPNLKSPDGRTDCVFGDENYIKQG